MPKANDAAVKVAEMIEKGVVFFEAGNLFIRTVKDDLQTLHNIRLSDLVGLTDSAYGKIATKSDPNAETRKQIRSLLDSGKTPAEILAILSEINGSAPPQNTNENGDNGNTTDKPTNENEDGKTGESQPPTTPGDGKRQPRAANG